MSDFVEALSSILGSYEQVQYGESATLAFQVDANGFKRRIIFEDPIPGAVKELPVDKCIEILQPLFSGVEEWPRQNPIVVRIFNEYQDGSDHRYEITCFLHGLEEHQVGNVVVISDPELLRWSKPSQN